MGEEISNKQVILSNYVKTSVKESDMSLRTSKIQLKIPSGCDGAVLVKNLYLSIDPFILALMKNQELDLPSFTLDSPIYGFGVSKVLDSSHPNFKTGELVWGFTGWEEYSLIKDPDQLFKDFLYDHIHEVVCRVWLLLVILRDRPTGGDATVGSNVR
ncbi:hypothetical protein SASPL_141598 [Salvia splendens]|uniref:Oxidoreductase N-terminal domain-containing protein n=1 Tax=Salvia splendens TaxID=180675 RepID=A0A8X8WQU7_SALSN|nr:(+)-pulegone reductase-like [Salvia splendens]KAG6400110.1 hypothetical protein SASPL_141598 [Salvia splendens]